MALERISDFLCRQDPDYYELEGGEPTHFCPACKSLHTFNVNKQRPNGARWSWDGNIDKPTFTPSMNIRLGPLLGGKMLICHYTLIKGVIKYMNDCTHKMRGQIVDLPPIPMQYPAYIELHES